MKIILDKRNKIVEKAIREEEKMEELKRARKIKADLKEAKKALSKTGGSSPLFRIRESNVKALEAGTRVFPSKIR